MYLILCSVKGSGAQHGWLSAMSPSVERIEVTRNHEHARRFKLENDAAAVRDLASRIAPDYNWKVVSAGAIS